MLPVKLSGLGSHREGAHTQPECPLVKIHEAKHQRYRQRLTVRLSHCNVESTRHCGPFRCLLRAGEQTANGGLMFAHSGTAMKLAIAYYRVSTSRKPHQLGGSTILRELPAGSQDGSTLAMDASGVQQLQRGVVSLLDPRQRVPRLSREFQLERARAGKAAVADRAKVVQKRRVATPWR